MKKKATGRRSPSDSRGSSTRRSPSAPQSLLILHLDADKLRRDGLHLGDVARFSGALSTIAFGAPVVIEHTTSTSHLHETLAGFVSGKRTFDVVVVVAHSNAEGIRIANDGFVAWESFAGYLKPFKPRRLLLVACRAGRWDAGEALFTAMPRLRRIFACPVNASKDLGALMLFAVPYVVAERRPRDRHVTLTQVASIAVTGRQLREWRRTTDKGNSDSAVFDLIADLADPLAREVPGALLSAVRTVFG
jgi:hypothetical protein